jgi:hypothetical protein
MRDTFSAAESLHDAAGLVAFRDDATAASALVVEELVLDGRIGIRMWV